MKIDEFVRYAKSDHCVKTETLATALKIVERQQDALKRIASVGILAPEKDTLRTARMREIAQAALDMEV